MTIIAPISQFIGLAASLTAVLIGLMVLAVFLARFAVNILE